MRRIVWGIALTVTLLTATLPQVAAVESVSDQFYAAIRANDLARVRALLASGINVNARDGSGVTPLMQSAVVGSLEAMALLIDAGADVNARNAFGSTALMWSASDLAKVRLLIDHDANVNAKSNRGRTAVLIAAMSGSSAEIVRSLIARGVDVHVVDDQKVTALHAATVGGDPETVRLLIGAGAAIDTPDAGGYTPLINAAQHGNLPVVRMLLAKGADVNAVCQMGDMQSHMATRVKNGPLALGHFTPLLAAAPYGPSDVIEALLDAGADVKARDSRGLTALMLAVASDHADPNTIGMLLAAGVDVNARSLAGDTALDWAWKAGRTEVVEILKRAGAVATPLGAPRIPEPSPVGLRPAFERSLALVETSSARFFEKGGCVACHAQNIADVAVEAARRRGLPVDDVEAASRAQMTKARFVPIAYSLLERLDVGGTPDVPAYSLLGLAAAGATPDWTIDAMVASIASQQRTDGSWHGGGIARPPISDGCDITRTAVVVRALAAYGAPGRAAEMRARIEQARAWLLGAPAVTVQDRSMRLLGLTWGGADSPTLRRAGAQLLAGQRRDGGWAQLDSLESDGYATGQALYALVTAGAAAPTDASHEKGVRFLLRTQRADGSWYVRSRAIGFQPFFESGFPYGHDQWISSMATGWATAALTAAAETRSLTHQGRAFPTAAR